MVNIYVHNEDKPDFWEEILRIIHELDSTYAIMGGDFNVVMDPTVDRNTPVWYNNNAQKVLQNQIDNAQLVDIWRVRNPTDRKFTWVKTKPQLTWSRIDYFLISPNMVNTTKESEILPCVHSDHSAILLTIETHEGKRGPGVWKLNDTLLDEETCYTDV